MKFIDIISWKNRKKALNQQKVEAYVTGNYEILTKFIIIKSMF